MKTLETNSLTEFNDAASSYAKFLDKFPEFVRFDIESWVDGKSRSLLTFFAQLELSLHPKILRLRWLEERNEGSISLSLKMCKSMRASSPSRSQRP